MNEMMSVGVKCEVPNCIYYCMHHEPLCNFHWELRNMEAQGYPFREYVVVCKGCNCPDCKTCVIGATLEEVSE